MDFNSAESAFSGYDSQNYHERHLQEVWGITPVYGRLEDQQPRYQHQNPHMMTSNEQFIFEQQLQQSRQQAMMERQSMMGGGNWQYPGQQHSPNSGHPPMFQAGHVPNQQYSAAHYGSLPQTPMDYTPQQQQAALESNMQFNNAADGAGFMPFASSSMDPAYEPLHSYHNDLQSGLNGYLMAQRYGHHQYGQRDQLSTSPVEHALEAQSSSGSESDWQLIPMPGSLSQHSLDSFSEMPQGTAAISNPGLTLHIRTSSNSSREAHNSAESINSFGSYEEVAVPFHSPQSEGTLDFAMQNNASVTPAETHTTSPVAICSSPSSSSTSPTSPTSSSPTFRRRKEVKDPIPAKTTKTTFKKPSPPTKKTGATEKRVGRRRGPLRPEQRIQAGEIRKLRACLRCKFLKKTCDKGDPCTGCQPSHARLWQVPCTRIDIKDVGYFIKDWKADYERHVTLGNSIANIKGYASQERPLFITHGYGFVFPIQAREVFVRDDDGCFHMDWVESCHESPKEFDQPTARLTIGMEGISNKMISEYLDQHIDGGFENFIEKHFEGTKFLTEMLHTAYRYYLRTKLPIIRKALKLVLAYNLTLHITMVDGVPEENMSGKVDDEGSKQYGKTLAPVMINFQVKHALASMWRELQRDVLEELSALYSSVYSGEKLKHWPTIFMLASMLLAVWEEIQFDSHYRSPDPDVVKKFCHDMEATPVGVITGLFSAISQKLPAFCDWDTRKHGQLLNNDSAVCDAMSEVRDHVLKHEDYLKSRADCKFDRNDFDSLSNKFLSRLVIRAN